MVKIILCPMYFGSLVAKHYLPVALQENEENKWERLGNDWWMLEMDEGDGLAWPWSCWSIWAKEEKTQVGLPLTRFLIFFILC